MLYRCELIDGNEIKERFYREGESVEAIREELEIFQWPEGKWHIHPATPSDEEE